MLTMREQHTNALKEVQSLVDNAKGRDFTKVEADRINELKSLVTDLGPKIKAADEQQADIKRMLDGTAQVTDEPTVFGKGAQQAQPFGRESKFADAFVKGLPTDGYGAKSISTAGTLSLPVDLAVNEPLPAAPLSLLQLIGTKTIAAPTYSYMRQTARTNNARVVAQGTTKPTSIYSLERIEGQTVTVAHLSEPVAKQDLADLSFLQQWISAELAYGVSRALQTLVLQGSQDGATPTFTGLLNTTGTLAVPYGVSTLATLRRAKLRLEQQFDKPTAIALNPVDWANIELTTLDDSGAFLLAGLPNGTAQPMLWGLPVIVDADVPEGQAIVGDFSKVGLVLREQIGVDWSDGGTDLFDKNLLKFRAECRAGLAITRPAAFAMADLTSGS